MDYMTSGYDSGDKTSLEAVTYVSFQELATRVSHRNTGKVTNDPIADRMLARIAKDENLHMVFYRNLLGASLKLAPSQTMQAIAEVVKSFAMPGNTIENFTRKSVQIALAGVYDLRIHRDEVLAPVLRHWTIWELEGLSGEGEKAREHLGAFMDDLDAKASRFEEKRAAQAARKAARAEQA
jgi:acyl-[acyl-carrier-protein] desaturase